MWMELAIFFGLYAVGGIVLDRFAANTPHWRRLVKLGVFTGITALIYATLGRPWSWVWLALLLLAVVYIHGIWLPRHGINGLTGEPRDKYEALRRWKA